MQQKYINLLVRVYICMSTHIHIWKRKSTFDLSPLIWSIMKNAEREHKFYMSSCQINIFRDELYLNSRN